MCPRGRGTWAASKTGLGIGQADWNPGSGPLSRASRKRAQSYHELQIFHHIEELVRIQGAKCEVSDFYLPWSRQ